MGTVGLLVLCLGLLLLAFVFAGPGRWWVESERRRRARLLEGTAGLHALGAEDQRERAVEHQVEAHTAEEAAEATREREDAEREIEAAAREGERARHLDPDRPSDPDPNRPELG
jgi:hypothetical protein